MTDNAAGKKTGVALGDRVPFWQKMAYGSAGTVDILAVWVMVSIAYQVFQMELKMSFNQVALILMSLRLWDGVADPVMGWISDNTRSRWGRRHPYILLGGLATAVCVFLFWTFPQVLTGQLAIFMTVLLINLLIRTSITVFGVPYTALGFEICPEYESRARLQGVRAFVNQSCNFIFCSFGWMLFFQDEVGEAGERIDGSLVASNYTRMGITLSIVVAVMAMGCYFGSRRYAVDNRGEKVHSNGLKDFWSDFTSIFKDRLAVHVFIFFIVAMFAMMLMGTVQMYAYILYMKFAPFEKTFVHGGGMLAFALASLSLSRIVHRYDKKQAGYIGIGLAVFGGLSLLTVFSGGLMSPQQMPFTVFGQPFHVSTLVFGALQMCWWGGCGIVVPLASSMVADVAAINYVKTGVLRNASYASVFSFSVKAANSFGALICGFLVQAAGIVSGADAQTPEAIRNIAILTFVSGPIVILCALPILRKYPITREKMAEIEKTVNGEQNA